MPFVLGGGWLPMVGRRGGPGSPGGGSGGGPVSGSIDFTTMNTGPLPDGIIAVGASPSGAELKKAKDGVTTVAFVPDATAILAEFIGPIGNGRVTILAQYGRDSISNWNYGGPMLRGRPYGTLTGYFARRRGAGNFRFASYLNGTPTVLDAAEGTTESVDHADWWYAVFEADESSLKAKSWPVGSAEPSGWDIEFSNTVHNARELWLAGAASGDTQGLNVASIAAEGTVPTWVPPGDDVFDFANLSPGSGLPNGWVGVGATPGGISRVESASRDGDTVLFVPAGTAALWEGLGSVGNADVYVLMQWVRDSTANFDFGGAAARYRGEGTLHGYHTHRRASQSYSLHRRVNGTNTQLGSMSSAQHIGVAGNWFWAQIHAVGNAIRGKTWRERWEPPSDWQVNAIDSNHASGLVGAVSLDTEGVRVAQVRVAHL